MTQPRARTPIVIDVRYDNSGGTVISNTYAGQENRGLIPAFDSAKLPSWWPKVSFGSQLQPGVRYVLDKRFENHPVAEYIAAKAPVSVLDR